MELGQVLVVLLYLWLFTSLGVYGWRAYRRIAHDETRADRAARRAEIHGVPGEPVAEGELVRRAIEEELAGVRPEGDDGRSGVFGERAPATDRPAVADLVTGIALPCDLVPLVGDDLDPHRAVFATVGHTAKEVGSALADELERLGFTLRTVADDEALAERDGDRLRVRVHEEGHRAHPGAPVHSVVAELTS
jgi:hypothetical protein